MDIVGQFGERDGMRGVDFQLYARQPGNFKWAAGMTAIKAFASLQGFAFTAERRLAENGYIWNSAARSCCARPFGYRPQD
jgi:hypothetical protein